MNQELRSIERYAQGGWLEEILEPGFDALGEPIHARAGQRSVPSAWCEPGGRAVRTVEGETDDRREARGIDGIAQSANVLRRRPDPDSRSEDVRCELGNALHRCGATADHYA